jgi:hypothetical protein
MNLIIAQVQRTMEGGHGSANKKPTVDKGTLYNMRCHVSDKTAYAEEEQPAAKGVEAKKPASSDNDDDKDSPTPAAGKNVDKAPRSPSYSHSSAASQEDAAMPEKDPEDAVKDPPEKSPPKDGTRKAQPVPKNDDAVSKPRSLQKVKKTVDKYGYSVVDPPNQVPKKNAEVIDELREEYDWYKLDKVKDKDLGFIDMVNRHASSLTLT